MKILAGALAVGLLLLAASLEAQNQGKQAQKKKGGDLPQARIAGEIPGERVSDSGKQSDWPAIAYASDGALYTAYVEWNDKDADRVVVRRNGRAAIVEDGNWDHYAPAIAARGANALVVWSGQSDGNFELYAAEVSSDGSVSKPEQLTRAPHSDFNVRAVSDAAGHVTVVWQSFRNGNADVYARRLSGERWGPEVRISTSEANDWEPAVALDRRGTAWISWDSYHAGNYDVMLRSFDGAKPGPAIPIATESTAQFHTAVAVDGEDRVWVAWDDAGGNWGKDYSRSSAAPGSRGLHYSRSLGVRVYANGRVQQPTADVSSAMTGRMTRYAELPHLATDASGALWLIFRHWTDTQPNEIYHFYAARLSGGEWSTPWRFSMSSGHNTQKAGIAQNPVTGELTVAYSSDGRSRTNLPQSQEHAMHYNVYVSQLPKGEGPPKTAWNNVTRAPAQTAPWSRRVRETMRAGSRSYRLLLGDAHRHTDIRGHNGVDGSVLDTYRYALDAAQLDWLGTADHNEVTGGRWPDGLRDYQWWTVQKTVDLMTHAPHFMGVYSYEHSMNRPGGHRNILFLKRGAPLRMIDRNKGIDAPDNSPPELWKWMEGNVFTQSGQKAVIVPHTFGAGPLADWNWPNARFDCLLEIYQGARGSYEAWRAPEKEKRGPTQVDEKGHFAQDALEVGNVYGFVSFSDHAPRTTVGRACGRSRKTAREYWRRSMRAARSPQAMRLSPR